MKILYRIAEKKNKAKGKNIKKIKPDWVNNQSCLYNLFQHKGASELIVFGDQLEESLKMTKQLADKFIETTNHGNAATFIEVLQYALDNFDSEEVVYFVEDDYIHRTGMVKAILEGLERADYVSLYDHPDKYGNSEILFYTKSSHWKFTQSTTMTFATKVKTLAFDFKIFKEGCKDALIPPDHPIWSFLTTQMHRRLATPIPGFATHGEKKWLAPVIPWYQYA